jgi:hypothetical protein
LSSAAVLAGLGWASGKSKFGAFKNKSSFSSIYTKRPFLNKCASLVLGAAHLGKHGPLLAVERVLTGH